MYMVLFYFKKERKKREYIINRNNNCTVSHIVMTFNYFYKSFSLVFLLCNNKISNGNSRQRSRFKKMCFFSFFT